MPTLKELLDDLEIDTSDLDDNKNNQDDKDKQFKLDDVDLEKIPEEQRELFTNMKNMIENQGNQLAQSQLVINTMKDFVDKGKKPKEEPKEDEKVLGVLDKEDPYAPAFSKLADMIGNIQQSNEKNSEKTFQENVVNFAQKNPDIVKYAKTMDKILEDHPTMKNDIPTLYSMAKSMAERRDAQAKTKQDEIDKQNRAKSNATEKPGASSSNATQITDSKNLTEAFENAFSELST